MNTPRFSAKLDTMTKTLALFKAHDFDPLVLELEMSENRPVIAVGSGGSHIVASYLSYCRQTLGHGITIVQTPTQLVFDLSSLEGMDVWLFSASADNDDLAAAAVAAIDRGCNRIIVCTRNAEGKVAHWTMERGGSVVCVPVADAKDGFLATHSLLASIAALLVASDAISENVRGADLILEGLETHLEGGRRLDRRRDLRNSFSALTKDTTIILLGDPRLAPATLLLETSIWEAALCSVQTTDVRNFAHGRHTWLHHRLPQAFVLSITGTGSDSVWNSAKTLLPAELPVFHFDYGTVGRFSNAKAVIDGLGWIEAIGESLGIDPGKPGVGDFGRDLYDDPVLLGSAKKLSSSVRHKLASVARADLVDYSTEEVSLACEAKLRTLCSVDISGLVLDYDGTMVTTERRREPPQPDIVEELMRLHHAGVELAFASGRGKSLGQAIRTAFPPDVAATILIGYYNGSFLRTADIDIALDRPVRDPVIDEIKIWLDGKIGSDELGAFHFGALQIEVDASKIPRPRDLKSMLLTCPALREGRADIVTSAHSFDVKPSHSSKLRVVETLEANLRPGNAVISIGDSGELQGNDHALLARPYGISVNAVCPESLGCWSLFGSKMTGPDALLRLLRAMIPSTTGEIRLNRGSLYLDGE